MSFAGCFIKVGQLEHMKLLMQNGLLFCNSISFFTKIEDQNLRGDDLETATEMKYLSEGEIILGKSEETPIKNGIKMPFKEARIVSRIIEPIGNLYCLYKINLLEQPIGTTFTVNKKMKTFGNSFVLIHNTAEFLKRIVTATNKLDLKISTDIVSYLDLSKYSGKKSLFQKDIKYQYQQEYRIFIKNKKNTPLSFEIGPIDDIVIISKSENLDKLLIKGEQKDFQTYKIHANLKVEKSHIN